MALKVWIGENLDRRHEQEQMKEFLSLMHSVYDNQPGQCHVLCNFICGGSQIDAAVVKQDAFIVVEFKTANGIVSGAENGKWRFEDRETFRCIEMKGGSHATNPFLQVANARTAVADKLKMSENVFFRKNECERILDWRHFVHGLVLLEPDLEDGATDEISVDFHTKPWFSCCRMKDVSETIYRTTTRDGDLSNKNILKIIEQVLHLEKAEMRDGVPMMPNSEDVGDEEHGGETVVPKPMKFQQTLGDVMLITNRDSLKKSCIQKSVTFQGRDSAGYDSTSQSGKTNGSKTPDGLSRADSVRVPIDTRRRPQLIQDRLRAYGFQGFQVDVLFEAEAQNLYETCDAASLGYDFGRVQYAICANLVDGGNQNLEAIKEKMDRGLVEVVPDFREAVIMPQSGLAWFFCNKSVEKKPSLSDLIAPPSIVPPMTVPNWFQKEIRQDVPHLSIEEVQCTLRLSAYDVERYVRTYAPRSFVEGAIMGKKLPLDFIEGVSRVKDISLIDLGCGPASFSLGVMHGMDLIVEKPCKVKYELIDGNGMMLAKAKRFVDFYRKNCGYVSISGEAEYKETEIESFANCFPQDYDLILTSKFIGERICNGEQGVYEDFFRNAFSHLTPQGLIMLVELKKHRDKVLAAIKNVSLGLTIVSCQDLTACPSFSGAESTDSENVVSITLKR